ncbi:SDR family NAD(P)-dependent oxidoreductase [Methylobacterium aquaticum]|uniref:Ketoreductase domain-containing protein n=1 Tax=Methylobacterium aquaticum TaxID=270351 RepID=A0A0J6VBC1_9HYPH|nr:SDR family NAD(P)-dependent oxidoreductase [Methylobacterium aquaticum]KMO36316.1 hypothetical protein VP06_10050 [Methylobacterium aquaticum]
MKTADLFDIRDRAVVITGGARGLGRSMAEAMVDNGARVMLLDRSREDLDRAVDALAHRGRVEGMIVDVADREGLDEAIAKTTETFGRLDVAFANAGIAAGPGFLSTEGQRDPAGAIEAIPFELWDRVVETNLTSIFATIRAAARPMKTQRQGRIVLTASIAGLRPGAIIGTPYMVTKAAVAHLAKQAALELARYNVLVNAIVPGPFLTQLTTPELEARFAAGSPIHRAGRPDEIQGLAIYLASAASSYVTGTHIVIDGGSMLGRAD